MTFVMTINGPDTIWMMADRRISFAQGNPRNDAVKVMFLQTTDGVALLGYAGLGLTVGGTEPSAWMNNVLKGRSFLSLEQSLTELAGAFQREFPRHLAKLPDKFGRRHIIIVSAFINGEAKNYKIDLEMSPDSTSQSFSWTDIKSPLGGPPRFGLGGSGALTLYRNSSWRRVLLNLVRACDRKRIKPSTVADYLAFLNLEVSRRVPDNSVGQECIILWRGKQGGGAHQFYEGTTRVRASAPIPSIGNGMDVNAIVRAMFSSMEKGDLNIRTGYADKDAINAELAKFHGDTDEKLK